MSPESDLRIVSVYPDLLGTYGDRGNAEVLGWRARRRGLAVETVTVLHHQPVPAGGDVYLLGGGEDNAQVVAAERLVGPRGAGLRRAAAADAVVFAVCAGYQILGLAFPDDGGTMVRGAGLLDVRSVRYGPRAVGEIVVEPIGLPTLGRLSGYENHAGRTVLGSGAVPFARTVTGVGNREKTGDDGARQGRLLGTYLHGPVLARNPDLADLLLAWVVGPLPPLDDTLTDVLRRQRITAALDGRRARPWHPDAADAPRGYRLVPRARLDAGFPHLGRRGQRSGR